MHGLSALAKVASLSNSQRRGVYETLKLQFPSSLSSATAAAGFMKTSTRCLLCSLYKTLCHVQEQERERVARFGFALASLSQGVES